MSEDRLLERYREGDVTLKELLDFLQNTQPVKKRLSVGDYRILCDWVMKIADALDITDEEGQS